MLNDDEVTELTVLFETPRKARTALLLSDVKFGDIANMPTDIVAFWEAMAKLYKKGYAPDTELRLRENVHEWLPGNKVFPAIITFSSAEQQLINFALEKVDNLQEIEAAADLLTVRATSRIDDVSDVFGAALLQLRGVVAQRSASNQALVVLEAEGAQSGQVRDETRRRLVDALTAVITTDEQFRELVTQAVHDARDARSVAGTGMDIKNTVGRNKDGNIVQTGPVFGGVHFNAPPRGGSPESTT
jgi:hypothetical protein